MRRILIFSLAYYPRFIGGAEVAIKEITDRISPQEVEFDMLTAKLTPSQPSFEKIGNVNVYRIGVGHSIDKFLFIIVGVFKTFTLLKKRKYDFFWGMMVTFSSGVPYIVNIVRGIFGRSKIPIILTLQEGDSEKHIRTRWLGMIGLSWRLALKRTNYLTVISTYLEERARAYGYVGPVSLVPNGVDYEKFTKSITEQRKSEIRSECGLDANDIVLVTSSRLVYKNATDVVISALAHLPKNYKFLILGTGMDEHKLRNQAQGLNVKDRVIFKGFVSHHDLPEYLQASDIFIRPSRSEGLGNSFLEAMAAGIPVIATQVGGIPDFLTDGETGLFCEVDNAQSIAQKVEKLVKDKESRDYIVKNAREMVKARYTWDEVAGKMKTFLTS